LLSVALVSAVFWAGCAPKAPPTGAGGEAPPAAEVAYDVKERFSQDTGIKDTDGKPVGFSGIAISPDGKRAVLYAAAKAGNVQVWDLEHRKKLAQYDSPSGSMLPVAVSPDGKLAAYPSQVQGAVVLLDLADGKELRRLAKRPLGYYVPGLVFSPGGDLLVVASRKEIVGLGPADGAVRFVLPETAEVSALSGFFDGGKKIASGTEAGTIKVWDVAARKVERTLLEEDRKEQRKVKKLFVSPDGRHLAADLFPPFYLWDLSSGQRGAEFRLPNFLWYTIQFLPDNRTVVFNGPEAFFLCDVFTGAKKAFGENKAVRHYPVAVTPDGSIVVSTEEDGTLRVWDVKATH
jgi:WD40 repeat protein